jgi:hypothetical protein
MCKALCIAVKVCVHRDVMDLGEDKLSGGHSLQIASVFCELLIGKVNMILSGLGCWTPAPKPCERST